MRAIRAASAALLGAAALALTAPTTAVAASQGGDTPLGVSVSPSTVAPGGRVTLSASGCRTSATASSAVFDTVTIRAGAVAAATVHWDARADAVLQVTFTCGTRTETARLTIAGRGTPAATTAATGDAPVSPDGVRGGLGGSIGGSIGGTNTTEIVAGTGLVVAASTGVIYAARRRAETRRH